jgi:hypothetical protein
MINRAFLRKAVGDFDPEWISLPRLYQMRKDPMVQLGLHYCKFPLIRAKWHIECEDRRIAAGVTEIVQNVYAAYTKMLLNKLDFGYQGGIKQFAQGTIHGTFEDERGQQVSIWDDDMVSPMILEPPLPLIPDHISPKIEDGKFAGINAALGGGADDPDKFVPPDWALWSVNEFEENFRNYYGYPRTGYAYRYWWSYWFRFHMEDRHFEQDADPALQVSYPVGESTGPDGKPINNRDLALMIGNDLRGGATIAWPSKPYIDEQGKPTPVREWEAEFLTGGENLKAFRESAEYLDIMKLRAILIPEQALVEGKGGTDSRASALGYQNIFQESLGQEAEDLDFVWNRYIIPQLVEANWGADAPKCTKVTTGFDDEDTALADELIKLAFTVDPNALPIDFDKLIQQARLPILSVKEQKERDQQLEEAARQQQQEQEFAAAEAARQAQEEGVAPEEGIGGGGSKRKRGPERVAQFSQADIPEGEKSFTPHPRLQLHQGEPLVDSTAPTWARVEHDRREANLDKLVRRLQSDLETRYKATFDAVADAIESLGTPEAKLSIERQWRNADLLLAFKDRSRVKKFLQVFNGIKEFALSQAHRHDEAVQEDVASMYHASGAAELLRLGVQDLDNWDVRNVDLQEWANEVVDRMLLGTDDSVLEVHIRPWLEEEFKDESYPFEPEPALSLAQKFRVHFMGYPRWMAERTARTEARHMYNNASLDVWELSGIKKVRAYDGLGGKSGKTDAACLARNGKIFSIAAARAEDEAEHPNGTLGFTPIIEETVFQLAQRPIADRAFQSASTFVIDYGGRILREETADGN